MPDGGTGGPPRWVVVTALCLAAVLLALLALALLGGGEHSPARHAALSQASAPVEGEARPGTVLP
jgi:hypothetical protein